ncbi:MAG: serine hydrolase domain-containing protein [Bacteroidota bacterium]
MNKILAIVLIVFFASCQTKTKQDSNASTNLVKDSLFAELSILHQKGNINGFGLTIVNEEGALYSKGIGYSDIESNSEYTVNTLQNIGSVSKTFIGISLLKAQELGKLKLDDPINNYLPFKVENPNHPEEEITIRHLATHTSTILDTDYYDEKSYILKDKTASTDSIKSVNETFNDPDSKTTLEVFLKKILSKDGEWYQEDGFMANKPGEIFEYSNIGATLAALVLEIATEQSFNEFATKNILEPLDMKSSGWSFENIDLSQHSKLYADPKTELPFYSLITYPDGGLITNISDFSKYLTELIKGYSGEGKLLNKNSYQELFREQLTAESFPERDEEDDFDDEYNTGIFMGFTPKGFIGHTGGDPGIATFMFFDPGTKTGRVMMINTSIINQEGVDQFYDTWNTLGRYEKKLTSYSD